MGRSVGRGLDPSAGVYGRHGACPPPRGRGRACPARGFSRGWAVAEGFRGVGDAAPYVGGCPLTGYRANLRRGVGTPPYGCNSRKCCRGGIYAARPTFPSQPLVAITAHHPNIHLAQTSPSSFVEKIKKTCKNLLTKVILLAIIIKLSREPSPRRQPLEPLPTACTPFFEENFFKKLSENLLTNERI